MNQNYSRQRITLPLLVNNPRLYRKILPIYWAFLTYTLLKPAPEVAKDYWFLFSGIDKWVHLAVFFFLGFLFRAAYPTQSFVRFLYIMLIYGLATEILQDELPFGRSLDPLDLFADILGILVGYIVVNKLRKYFQA